MSIIDPSKPVLITSAGDYASSWVVRRLLEAGCTVHATVKDPDDVDKLRHLDRLADQLDGPIKYYQCNPLEEGSYAEAMHDCSRVFHTHTPLTGKVRKARKELIEPTVAATRNLLTEVNRNSSVQRVVMTSSCGAIYSDNIDLKRIDSRKFTEEDWNETASARYRPHAYAIKQSEQEAWRIAENQDDWDLVVLNPASILGPGIDPHLTQTPFTLFKSLCDGSMKWGMPNYNIGVVDVRDLADAHILAAWNEDAWGRNIILGHHTSLFGIAKRLDERFNLQFSLPKRTLPKFMVWLSGTRKDKSLTRDFISRNIGYPFCADNSKSIDVLGMKYRRLDETVCDTFQQMSNDGIIQPRRRSHRRRHVTSFGGLFHDSLR